MSSNMLLICPFPFVSSHSDEVYFFLCLLMIALTAKRVFRLSPKHRRRGQQLAETLRDRRTNHLSVCVRI